MAIRTVVTRGYGNGTFNGTIPLVVTRGYVALQGATPPTAQPFSVDVSDAIGNNRLVFKRTAGSTEPVESRNSVTTS